MEGRDRHSISINYLAFHSFFFLFLVASDFFERHMWSLLRENKNVAMLLSCGGYRTLGTSYCVYISRHERMCIGHNHEQVFFFYGFFLLIVMIWQKKILSVFLDFLCILTGAHFCSYKRALVSQKLDKINSPGIGKIQFDGTAFFSSTF